MAIVRQFSFIPASYTPYAGELTARTPTYFKITGTEFSSIWHGSGLKYNGAGNTVVSGTLSGFMFEKDGKIAGTVEGLQVTIKSMREGASPGAVIFAGNDKFYGHGGIDYVSLADGNDTYYGGGGADVLVDWGAGRDRLFGEVGNDTLRAGAGADVLNGGAHNDVLYGEDGFDLMIGGLGRDRLHGGNGADRFVFQTVADSVKGGARDVIFDFSQAERDKIDVSGIDANGTAAGEGTFKYIGADAFGGTRGELRFENYILSGDVNGDRIADFEIKVSSSPATLAKADFIL